MKKAGLFGLVVWALCGLPAQASDIVGIYAIVDRVAFEPDSGAAERIQIWGAFSLAGAPGTGDSYSAPERGYMYYFAVTGQEKQTRAEWNDLAALAGTGQCVAFASRYEPKGTVRPGCEEPSKPDPYPIANGITKTRSDTEYLPIHLLVSTPIPISPADGSSVAPGPVTLVIGNVLDPVVEGESYLFEIKDSRGGTETSPAVPAGKTQTEWTPAMQVAAGAQYDWSARRLSDETKQPVATACFTSTFIRGDANSDTEVDVSDAVFDLLFLFSGGPAPSPLAAGDVDGNGSLELTDAVYLLSYLFQGGSPPPPPFPSAGLR